MELVHLRVIVDGLDSLAAIEKEHPVLGAQLLKFAKEVRDCCTEAYQRFSKALGAVTSLPRQPTPQQFDEVLVKLRASSDSKWFRDVALICERLAALASDFEEPMSEQIRYTSPFGDNWELSSNEPESPRFAAHHRIAPLFSLLQRHESDLKDDIRTVVATLEMKLADARADQNAEDARAYALSMQHEISQSIDAINKTVFQIAGTSSIDHILSSGEIAQQALQTPERMLIINMFFLVVVVALGAAVFQVISIPQFVLLSGFTITAVIVLNAFYLKTIDNLSEESFLKLMELALLKFFAPLSKRGKPSKSATGAN